MIRSRDEMSVMATVSGTEIEARELTPVESDDSRPLRMTRAAR